MHISVSVFADGNLAPKAWKTIKSLPEAVCFHQHHGKRHPVSAYGTSLRAITEQWAKTATAIVTLTSEHNWVSTETSYGHVLKEYRELLYRLNEHHDACLSVLRSLCPPTLSVKPTKFDDQFLAKAKLVGSKHFLENTQEYRVNQLGALVNSLKHDQCELNSIFFHSPIEFRPGYYLRDILPGGVLGPSAKLHNDGRTAFSFSRDMMMHFWWLYRIGDLLSAAIRTAVKDLHSLDLNVLTHPYDDDNLLPTIRSCAALNPVFFPDESKRPYARILLAKSEQQLNLEFPTRAPGNEPKNSTIGTAFKVDGSHLTNKLPYFGTEFSKWIKNHHN